MTKKQLQDKEWLRDNHWREWITTRENKIQRLSCRQKMWCCCGAVASSMHEERCAMFQNKVDAATIKSLKHLLPTKQNK